MEKQEFETIITPQVNNGVGGRVADIYWEDIEMVYNETNLTKVEVADIFWNHTGLWSELVRHLKRLLEGMKKFREYEQALEQLKELRKQSAGKVLKAANMISDIASNYRCAKSKK